MRGGLWIILIADSSDLVEIAYIASLATLPAAEIAAIAPIHFAPDLFAFFHPAAVEPAGTFA